MESTKPMERGKNVKKGPGRPPVNDEPKDKITIVVTVKQKTKFTAYCEKRGKSVSGMLGEMIQKAIENAKS
jgi:uncharacterized cupredoxin-like copper-binding protein